MFFKINGNVTIGNTVSSVNTRYFQVNQCSNIVLNSQSASTLSMHDISKTVQFNIVLNGIKQVYNGLIVDVVANISDFVLYGMTVEFSPNKGVKATVSIHSNSPNKIAPSQIMSGSNIGYYYTDLTNNGCITDVNVIKYIIIYDLNWNILFKV